MNRFNEVRGNDDDEKSEETSIKKINALNNDIMSLRNDLGLEWEQILELNKKHEIEKREIVNEGKKENMDLHQKYKREISDSELKLKCVKTEYLVNLRYIFNRCQFK